MTLQTRSRTLVVLGLLHCRSFLIMVPFSASLIARNVSHPGECWSQTSFKGSLYRDERRTATLSCHSLHCMNKPYRPQKWAFPLLKKKNELHLSSNMLHTATEAALPTLEQLYLPISLEPVAKLTIEGKEMGPW